MRRRPLAIGLLTATLLAVTTLTAAPASAAPAIVPTRLPYPTGGTNAIGPGIDFDNSNAQLAETIPATIKPGWTASPPLCSQAGGSSVPAISVARSTTVVLEREYGCSFVSAYSTSTGALRWRVKYDVARDLRVTGGIVYVATNNEDSYYLDALDLRTGAKKWSKPFGWQIDSIGSGLISSGLMTLNAKTGTLGRVFEPDASGRSLMNDGRIYLNVDSTVSATSATTGDLIWRYQKPGLNSARGDALPQLHEGRLYIRSDYELSTVKVLDPSTGKVIRQLPESQSPIAFDGDFGFFTKTALNKPSVITAVNLKTGVKIWSHSLPSSDGNWSVWEKSAPVVSNGLVWLLHASSTGSMPHLAAFDEVTGATRSSTVLTCEAGTNGALVLAQHRLFASSDCGVRTYLGK